MLFFEFGWPRDVPAKAGTHPSRLRRDGWATSRREGWPTGQFWQAGRPLAQGRWHGHPGRDFTGRKRVSAHRPSFRSITGLKPVAHRDIGARSITGLKPVAHRGVGARYLPGLFYFPAVVSDIYSGAEMTPFVEDVG